MNTSSLPKLLFVTLAAGGLLLQTASALITVETVPVGNAGNAADPTTGYGAVGYDYGIGKYEVTLHQYTAFLNAVGATDTYGLYNTSIMGVSQSGASGSYSYSVIGSGNRPVTYVSWYDSARFVNWLHNGQPIGLQAAGTTETGAYTLIGNTGIIMRNSGATYSLPSEDEWYKAAYYNGGGGGYSLYPGGVGSDPSYGSVNFNGSAGGITDVGAYTLAASYYGTFDQAGNVWEWNDAIIGSSRGLRGGSWTRNFFFWSRDSLKSSFQNSTEPANDAIDGMPSGGLNGVGFRVAIVPEPSVGGLMMLGLALVAWKRK